MLETRNKTSLQTRELKGNVWKKLWRYGRPYKRHLFLAIFSAVSGTLLSLMGPGLISKMTDLIQAGLSGPIDLPAVSKIGMRMLFFYVSGALLLYFQGFITATVTQKISFRLREDLSEKLNRLPLRYFDQTSYGDILSRVTNDVDLISQTLNQSISTLMIGVILLFGTLALMLFTSILLTVTAVGSTLAGLLLMVFLMKRSQRFFKQQQQDLGRMNGHIEEVYTGQMTVKMYNAEGEEKQTFSKINEALYQSAWKSQFLSGLMMPIMTFVGNLGYVSVCVVGGAMAFKGMISFGVVIAFIMYIGLFTQPLSQLAQAANRLQATSAAGERVFEFLEEEELSEESDTVKRLDSIKGHVTFDHVRFGYNPEKPVIHDFSAHVSAGQKVAIVGPTGAGKTTIVNLLMRFYEVDRGQIRVDDVPIEEITRENLHELFCMVLQDTWLFEGTILENLIYNKKGVTLEKVEAVCRSVGLDHFIRTLPKGYDTLLNEQTSLSIGQKQMLTIARAMIDNAPLLILDEATSSVDTRTELIIQKAMDQLMEGRTSFVIAHRLSTIQNADLILVMKDGDIIESGTHSELLAIEGFYSHLYNSQFS